MPLTIICDLVVNLPTTYLPGAVCDAVMAEALNTIMFSRIRAKATWNLKQGKIRPEEVEDFMRAEIAAFTFDNDPADPGTDDAILAEAIAIARDLITRSLAAEGLAPPPSLDLHAKTLAETDPNIRAQAQRRVEVRLQRAREALNMISQPGKEG